MVDNDITFAMAHISTIDGTASYACQVSHVPIRNLGIDQVPPGDQDTVHNDGTDTHAFGSVTPRILQLFSTQQCAMTIKVHALKSGSALRVSRNRTLSGHCFANGWRSNGRAGPRTCP